MSAKLLNKKRVLLLLATIIFLALFFLAEFLSPRDELVKADVIIAISGGDTAARTRQAVELYKEGWAPKLIFSGDAYDPLSPSNADVMKRIATLENVVASDIIIEEASDNTTENAQHTKDIILDAGYQKIILVTAQYHQRRAYIEFRDSLGEDIEIINYPAQEGQWDKTRWYLSSRGWYLTISESVKVPISWLRTTF